MTNLRNKTWIFVFICSLFLLGCQETEARDASIMGSQFLYDDCKAALAEHSNDEKAFAATSCGVHISGFLQGYYVASHHMMISRPDDPCNHVYTKISEQLNSRICFPKSITLIGIAQEYVSYSGILLHSIAEDKREEKKAELPGIGGALMKIYQCEAEQPERN